MAEAVFSTRLNKKATSVAVDQDTEGSDVKVKQFLFLVYFLLTWKFISIVYCRELKLLFGLYALNEIKLYWYTGITNVKKVRQRQIKTWSLIAHYLYDQTHISTGKKYSTYIFKAAPVESRYALGGLKTLSKWSTARPVESMEHT